MGLGSVRKEAIAELPWSLLDPSILTDGLSQRGVGGCGRARLHARKVGALQRLLEVGQGEFALVGAPGLLERLLHHVLHLLLAAATAPGGSPQPLMHDCPRAGTLRQAKLPWGRSDGGWCKVALRRKSATLGCSSLGTSSSPSHCVRAAIWAKEARGVEEIGRKQVLYGLCTRDAPQPQCAPPVGCSARPCFTAPQPPSAHPFQIVHRAVQACR